MICETHIHNHNHNHHHHHHSYTTHKMHKCQAYIDALEEERRKIQVFQRELPLCLELVTQAIEACKQQLFGTTKENFQSECSEQTSNERPVLEEFMPIKRKSCSDDDDDDDEQQSDKSKKNNNKDSKNINGKSLKKSDWLRSAQLWNQTPDLPTKENSPRKVQVIEVKGNGDGTFHAFKKDKTVTKEGKSPSSVSAAAASSTAESGGGGGSDGKKEEKEGQSQRKTRRCWSPELHRRFLHALQELGGAYVATPKQIRELMKVDGLTNDEVKSHLQKYRLHARRPTPSTHNNNPQAPQFVVVGGIWVPPQEYTAVATAAASHEASGVTAPNGIYTTIPPPLPPPPIAQMATFQTQRQQYKQAHSDKRAGDSSENGVHSKSPASSSSTHTVARVTLAF